MVEITSANFDEMLNSGRPMMVDFWARWCGPCNTMGKILEEFEKEYGERIIFGKCDIEVEKNEPMKYLPTKYSVRSIPTLLFFKNGEQVMKLVGIPPGGKGELKEMIESLL